MKAITKLLLFTMVLLLVGLGTISATDNVSDTSQTTDIGLEKITDSHVMEDTTTKSSVQTTNQKTIEKNDIENTNKSVKEASTITVNPNNYDYFFEKDEEGKIKSTDMVQEGDTLNLKGTFNNVDFAVDKSITLTSLSNNAFLNNCTVRVQTSGSGSTISNLVINNSKEYTPGFLINDAENLTVENNYAEVCGLHSYAFEANLNHSMIRSNYFETHQFSPETERVHTALVLSDSFYNTILNNTVVSTGANCIYLSTYPGVDIRGGPSNYNNITGNLVQGVNSAWSYSIQIMGNFNKINENTVSGGYRGVSTAGTGNLILENDVDAENRGIDATDNSTVIKNYVHVSGSSTGITVEGDNILVSNNTIISQDGAGIDIQSMEGSNLTISGNDITTNNYGIYSKGQYSRIVIKNNKIISEKEGILFKQRSRTKKMNHIRATNNNIKSEADYAINFNETGSTVASDVNVTVAQSNVLSSKRGVGLELAYLPPSNSNGSSGSDSNQVIRINSNNYTSWFENGVAKDTVLQNATVYLKGTFNNLNFTFTKKVHIIGENCLIKNGTITLAEDAHASTITDVKINNAENINFNVHGIELFEVNNCKLTNINIVNYAKYESFGIFIYDSNGNTITDCVINTTGDYVNNGMFIYSGDINLIQNNTVNILQSDIPIPYADAIQFDDKIGTIQEILHNHGIVLVYSSNNVIDNNKINATSLFKNYTFPTEDCKNSIVGIDVYFDSHSNQITNNYVSVKSFGPFSYGIGVLGGQWGTSISASNAKNNIYQNNYVNVQGGYFATGFIAGRNSINTLVDSNTFIIDANRNKTDHGDYALGITLENSTKSTISNNKLTLNGAAVYGMELFDSGNNTIVNNSLTGTASFPYGIAGYASSNNKILNNTLTLKTAKYGSINSAEHADAIPYGDEGIMFMTISKNNVIKFNKVNTTANTTVKLTDQTANNKVTENSLVSKKAIGDSSVINLGTSNTVSNNFVHFVNATANPIHAFIGDTITLVANVNTTTTDTSNLTVVFQLGANNVGTSKVVNGKASLKYNVSTLWNPTTYQITAYVSGDNFQNATAISQAVFEKHPDKTNVNVAKVLATVGSNAKLSAEITTLSGGKVGSGEAEFYVDGVKIDTVTPRLGVATCTYPIAGDAENKVHTIDVVYIGTSDYDNSTGSNILGVQSISTVSVANHTATIDKIANIKANITSGGKKVASGKVNIFIDDTKLTTATISKGEINTNVTIPTTFDKGSHTLKIVYDGNDTLSSATGSATIKLNPITPVFHYNTTEVGVGANASLILAIDNGKTGSDLFTANDGNVSVKLNDQLLKDSSGKVIYGTMKNGKLTFKFTAPAQLIGSQNLTFIYTGNSQFPNANKTYVNGLKIGKTNVKITINKIANVKYNDNVTITGKFTEDNGKAISNTNLNVSINGKQYKTKTDGNGVYNFSTQVKTVGVNNVTVSYAGNTNYNSYAANSTFTVKQPTWIKTASMANVEIGTTVKIVGRLLSNVTGQAIKYAQVTVKVNNETYQLKTDGAGYVRLNYTVNDYNVQKITFKYNGNSLNLASSNSTSFKVKQPTWIKTANMANVDYGSTVKVVGRLLNNNSAAVKYAYVNVTVNNKVYKVKTDGAGYIRLNYTVNNYDVQKITFKFAGNNLYAASTNSTSFKVKQPTWIKIGYLGNVPYGSTVKVVARLLSGSTPVKYAYVNVTVNNKVYKVKTDGAGYIRLNYTVNSYDDQKITFKFAGNNLYAASTNSTTFKVKQPTLIKHASIGKVKQGSIVKFTGRLLYNETNPVKYVQVNVTVNGKVYNLKTDGAGYFRLNYTATTVGTFTFISKFGGNNLYLASTNSTKFTVVKS